MNRKITRSTSLLGMGGAAALAFLGTPAASSPPYPADPMLPRKRSGVSPMSSLVRFSMLTVIDAGRQDAVSFS
jgi:hypothetical protein